MQTGCPLRSPRPLRLESLEPYGEGMKGEPLDFDELGAAGSPYLTTEEAAVYCRAAGSSTVRGWIRRGIIAPDGKAGTRGTYLFKVTTLDAFLVGCAYERVPLVCVETGEPSVSRWGSAVGRGLTYELRLRKPEGTGD